MDLLERVRAGDAPARDELFSRYQPALRRFLHGRLPAQARGVLDTQDAAQEVCIKVFRRLEHFDHRGVGAFWAYLRQVALNYLRDLPKTPNKLSRAQPMVDESWAQPPSKEQPPPLSLSHKEELEAFERALRKVEPRQRDALLMRLELDLEYRLIAQECGFPSPDAARMAIARTLETVCREMSHERPE